MGCRHYAVAAKLRDVPVRDEFAIPFYFGGRCTCRDIPEIRNSFPVSNFLF